MDNSSVIKKIVDLEFEMFMNVNAEGNPACRESPEGFSMHRRAQFSVWSDSTLLSYLDDLIEADAAGRNLMTYKYARMDNLMPAENNSSRIDMIIEEQINWQRSVIKDYPLLMRNARGLTDGDESILDISFARYLHAELESYSEHTLELLWNDICRYKKNGVNMSELIYLNLVGQMGFDSLESFR